MIFFRLTLSPVDIPVPLTPSREVAGLIFAPMDNIEEASPLVVKGLHAAGWRIINVLEARSIRERDTLLLNASLAALYTQAEETGFAFLIEDTGSSEAATQRTDATTHLLRQRPAPAAGEPADA